MCYGVRAQQAIPPKDLDCIACYCIGEESGSDYGVILFVMMMLQTTNRNIAVNSTTN